MTIQSAPLAAKDEAPEGAVRAEGRSGASSAAGDRPLRKSPMAALTINAPLEGWLSSLDEAPDPVFAGRMMGEGVLIDPLGGRLIAPCAGVVASLPASRHAVTIRADNGAEILMHVGIETVALKGEGFTAHVSEGERVAAGALLLTFDMNALAAKATSLQTPIVVVNGEAFQIVRRAEAGRVKSGDFIMSLEAVADSSVGVGEHVASAPVRMETIVPLSHGIHARPAARLADVAKKFNCRLLVSKGGKSASARSPVALMTLGVKHGDRVEVSGEGADAEEAVKAAVAAIASGLGEETAAATPPAVPAKSPAVAIPVKPVALDGTAALKGVTAAPGAVSGRVLRIESSARDIQEKGAGSAAERRALDAAMRKLRVHLDANAQSKSGQQKEVLTAHLALLDDECLREEALALIDRDKSAAFAWRAATRSQIAALESLDDPLLAERADDLADIERQIVAFLSGDAAGGGEENAAGAVIVASELYPSQFIRLAEAGAAGICLTGGGPTSHVSILAGEKGVPALVAVEAGALTIPDGVEIILDADRSRVHVAPDAAAVAAFQNRLKKKKATMADALSRAGDIAITRDGVRIDVFANLGGEKGAAEAVALGAEGCGLLRTEFLYLGRASAPSEDEQHAAYQAVADGLDGRPLVIRALDIGGDKPAPFVDIDAEENPALGLRGVRLLLARRDLLEDQLRAILRVKTKGDIHIMLPMVVSLGEISAVREILDAAARDLGVEKRPSLGVMIETPASAIAADTLARGADFFSIGTNDLAQYVLAMDRGNPALAANVDSLHPAVLRMVKAAAEAGARRGKWVGVCGSLASDPVAAPLLVGLGVTELSAAPRRTPAIKAVVRTLTLGECRSVAGETLDLASADEVRKRVLSQWPQIEDWL